MEKNTDKCELNKKPLKRINEHKVKKNISEHFKLKYKIKSEPNKRLSKTNMTKNSSMIVEESNSHVSIDNIQELKESYKELQDNYQDLFSKYVNLTTQYEAVMKVLNQQQQTNATQAINDPEIERLYNRGQVSENFFSALNEDMDGVQINNSNLTKENENENNELTNNKTSTNRDTKNNKTEYKLPPIVCYNLEVKELSPKIQNLLGHNKFLFKKINKDVTHIFASNSPDFHKIKTFLKKSQINHYNYTPKDEKPLSFVVKGIDPSFTLDDIYSAFSLQKLNINIIKIFKLGQTNNWVIQIHPNDNPTDLLNIRYILHQKIHIGKLKNLKMSQCKNCQRFGHVAINCNMSYRCVKCTEKHDPGKCSLKSDPNNEQVPARCVNCGQLGHPASYKGCPKYKEILERKHNNYPPKEPKNLIKTNFVSSNISYAQIAKKSLPTKPKIPNDTYQTTFFNTECEKLFGHDLSDCLNLINNFLPKYKAIDDINKKREAFLQLCIQLIHDA